MNGRGYKDEGMRRRLLRDEEIRREIQVVDRWMGECHDEWCRLKAGTQDGTTVARTLLGSYSFLTVQLHILAVYIINVHLCKKSV